MKELEFLERLAGTTLHVTHVKVGYIDFVEMATSIGNRAVYQDGNLLVPSPKGTIVVKPDFWMDMKTYRNKPYCNE